MIDWCWCVDISNAQTDVKKHQENVGVGENPDLQDSLRKTLSITDKDDKKTLAADAIYWNEDWNRRIK